MALMFKMAFQVVELTVDADHNVIDRKVIPNRYLTRKEAIDAIKGWVSGFPKFGYEPTGDFWWTKTEDGKAQIRFIIESV